MNSDNPLSDPTLNLTAFRPRSERREPAQDGFSNLSRRVGEDFSELGEIFVHSESSLLGPEPRPLPDDDYVQRTLRGLQFSSQRDLYETISRLTLGWGCFACQITLGRLSRIAGIRNAKTLRKWLGDLHGRKLIRYIPIHGDVRGAIIVLTPPEHVRLVIERNWRGLR